MYHCYYSQAIYITCDKLPCGPSPAMQCIAIFAIGFYTALRIYCTEAINYMSFTAPQIS